MYTRSSASDGRRARAAGAARAVAAVLAITAAGAARATPADMAAGGAAHRAPFGDPVLGIGTALHLGLGLVAVLAAIAVAAFMARRMLHLRPGMNGQMRVLAGISMGARERVVLLQVGETQLLLGVAPGRVQTLHVLGQPVSAAVDAAPGPATTAFAGVLRRLVAREGRGNGAASGGCGR